MSVQGRPHGRSLRAASTIVIVLAAVVMYGPTIRDYFLQDDFGVVGLFSQRPVSYFPRWFVAPWTEDIWGYVPDEIRPFPALSYVVMSWFGAAAPEPNHIVNIAVHAVNGLLVMGIAEAAAGLALVPAMFAGLVFVLLPIQAESVAWVTGRVDSLPTCFYFASFLLYVRSVRLKADATDGSSPDAGRSKRLYWGSVVLFFAALFSKQNTITMAPALVLFDVIVGPEGSAPHRGVLEVGAACTCRTCCSRLDSSPFGMCCFTRSRAKAFCPRSEFRNFYQIARVIWCGWCSAVPGCASGHGATRDGLSVSPFSLPTPFLECSRRSGSRLDPRGARSFTSV